MVLKAGATLITDNKYSIELANGSRVPALPSSEESIRGSTVNGWIVADEAAYLTDEMIASLRPMRAQRPEARIVMLSTANTRTDTFGSAWESGVDTWTRIQATVGVDPNLYNKAYLEQERCALGEDRYKREFLRPGRWPSQPIYLGVFRPRNANSCSRAFSSVPIGLG